MFKDMKGMSQFIKDIDSAKKVCNNFKDCKIIDHTKK